MTFPPLPPVTVCLLAQTSAEIQPSLKAAFEKMQAAARDFSETSKQFKCNLDSARYSPGLGVILTSYGGQCRLNFNTVYIMSMTTKSAKLGTRTLVIRKAKPYEHEVGETEKLEFTGSVADGEFLWGKLQTLLNRCTQAMRLRDKYIAVKRAEGATAPSAVIAPAQPSPLPAVSAQAPVAAEKSPTDAAIDAAHEFLHTQFYEGGLRPRDMSAVAGYLSGLDLAYNAGMTVPDPKTGEMKPAPLDRPDAKRTIQLTRLSRHFEVYALYKYNDLASDAPPIRPGDLLVYSLPWEENGAIMAVDSYDSSTLQAAVQILVEPSRFITSEPAFSLTTDAASVPKRRGRAGIFILHPKDTSYAGVMDSP